MKAKKTGKRICNYKDKIRQHEKKNIDWLKIKKLNSREQTMEWK